MDPWVLQHLRLARSRGSLKAPNSPLQDRALEILNLLDDIEARKDRTNAVRALLVNKQVDREMLHEQFSDFFDRNPFAAAETDTGEFDPETVDESLLDWSVPDDEGDNDISAWIAARESQTFTAQDLVV